MTEPNVAENQTAEEQGASDSLDSLLNEFENETKPVEQKSNVLDEVVSFVQEERAAKAKAKEDTDIKGAVTSIKGSLEGLDFIPKDGVIRGMLNDVATQDPLIAKAFQNRDQNPRAWDEALKRATNKIKEELSIDIQTTSDREAITSAVHSASTKQPKPEEAPNVATMNDREFIEYKTKLMRGG